MRRDSICLIVLSATLWQCTPSYAPKPKGYNRLPLPPVAYRPSPDSLPYAFEYSTAAKIRPYEFGVTEKNWIEIVYPTLKAYIHITYKPLNGNQESQKQLRELLTDAQELVAKQQIKAYAIDDAIVKTKLGHTVLLAEISGEVPTQLQFAMTDSSRHFLRGALYFKSPVQNDSLAPAIAYMKKEVIQLINTLRWH